MGQRYFEHGLMRIQAIFTSLTVRKQVEVQTYSFHSFLGECKPNQDNIKQTNSKVLLKNSWKGNGLLEISGFEADKRLS